MDQKRLLVSICILPWSTGALSYINVWGMMGLKLFPTTVGHNRLGVTTAKDKALQMALKIAQSAEMAQAM
eukprot:5407837-Amphidinium_carterae.1